MDVPQARSKTATATAAQISGLQMGIATTAPTHGMEFLSTSTAMNSIVTVAIAPIAMAAEIQLALAVLVKVARLELKPTVMLQVVPILVTTRHAVVIHAMAVVAARQGGRKIAKALASPTMSTKRGSATPSVMMAPIFLQITGVMNAPQVLRSG